MGRCEAVDMLASLLYYYMDVRMFKKRWKRRLRDSRGAVFERGESPSGTAEDTRITEFEKIGTRAE